MGVGLLGFLLITPRILAQEWQLVWSDEFEMGSQPGQDKWSFQVGGGGWGNQELQYYTNARPENARIENRRLIIEAETRHLAAHHTLRQDCERLGKGDWQYGRFEIRARLIDVSGRQVFSRAFRDGPLPGNALRIRAGEPLSPGVYVLLITTDTKTFGHPTVRLQPVKAAPENQGRLAFPENVLKTFSFMIRALYILDEKVFRRDRTNPAGPILHKQPQATP